MKDKVRQILEKTERFIRAYYKNMMLKGAIIAFTLVLSLFILADIVEYFGWLNTTVRTVVFYTYIAVFVSVVFYYVIIPLLKMWGIGKTMTREHAAKIIGRHIKEVDDKLLNSIELLKQIENSDEKADLLLASIEQKASELSPVPFVKAVDKKQNVKYVKYLVPVLATILIILVFSPKIITEPSKRIILHDKEFRKPLPYRFELLSDSLVCLQNDDFTVKVSFSGEEIPANVFIENGNNRYLMNDKGRGIFTYTFKTVRNDTYFSVTGGKFKSRRYHIKVFPRPLILSYDIQLTYPSYLGKKNELIENTSQLVLPEGTLSKWKIYTKDVDTLFFDKKNEEIEVKNQGNVFGFELTANDNYNSALVAKNRFTDAADSMYIEIDVIKDMYPKIRVNRIFDKDLLMLAQFEGEISDDYGFHSLKFFYKKSKEKKWRSYNLKIENTTQLGFSYALNLNDFDLRYGEKLEYYFAVSDNDELHHYKTTKTAIGTIEMPSDEVIETMVDSTSQKIKDEIDNILKKLQEINKKIEQNKLNMLNKKEMTWMDKERIKNLFKEQEQLQMQLENLNNLKQELDRIEKMKKENLTEDMKSKMEELQNMFNRLQNPEMLEQLKKAQEEIEKTNKDKLNKMLDEIKKNNEELQKNLEQNDEIYKMMEFEKKFTEALQKLDSLAKKQMSEAIKNENKLQNKSEAKKNQEKLNKEFENAKEQLEKAMDLNKQLEDPYSVRPDKKTEQEIKEEMNQASEKLENKKQKKASENQKNAAQKMKKMKDALQAAFEGEMEARMGEDEQNMKRLMDNLVLLSFEQEKSIERMKITSKNDPKFVENIDRLQQIRENYKIIDDSLQALAKRNIFVKPFILKESTKVKSSLDRAAENIQERYISKSLTNQQYAMTSMNNLALLIEESLEKMQQSMMNMKNSGKGKQQCKNPGQGKGKSLSEMLQKQKELSNSLKKMKGEQKGKQKNGKQGGGENGDSEKLAKMAALQQQIREMLQDYMEQLKSDGGNGNAMNKILKDMLENEKDMVNKNITDETLKRQKDIEVRLLKAENARLEREKKKERESKEGKNIKRGNLNLKLEYKKEVRQNKDIIITEPVRLNPFYRNLHNKYINRIEKENGSVKQNLGY